MDRIREAASDDVDILWDFLAMAAYEPGAAAAKAIPIIAAYLDGWRKHDDFGFVAERNGTAVGAAWARQFGPHEDPAYYRAERTPEITVAVNDRARGQRVGQVLVSTLIAEAARRELRLCLNVRNTNPALRLYERLGFRAVPGMTVPNRVGGLSIWMVWAPPL